MIFLSRVVIGPGIFIGVEALLQRLHDAGMAPGAGVRAIYAVLIYATGFAAWEIPRTHRQSQAAYASSFRREFGSLPRDDFPLAGAVIDDLGHIAGEEQFELGLTALVTGLTRDVEVTVSPSTAKGGKPAVRYRKDQR